MDSSRQKNIKNNIHIIKPIINEINYNPNNQSDLRPIIKYIKDLTPIHYTPNKINPKENKIENKIQEGSKFRNTINKTIFDIDKLTINNNTNLTNLNLYFLYNTEDNKSRNDKKPQNSKSFKKKEPKDTIAKKRFTEKAIKLKFKNPKNFENDEKIKRHHSIKYTIRKINSKSPRNNTSLIARKKREIIEQNRKKEREKKKELINKTTIIKEKEEENELELKIEVDDNIKKNIKSKIKDARVVKIMSINEPIGNLNLSEFIKLKQIGKGTFGKIYAVKWKNNGKEYALKKETFNNLEFIEKRKSVIKIINDFLEKTKSKGVINIYSSLSEKNKNEYNYYELMEIGERDWDEEIKIRRKQGLYYTEIELFNIANQLIKTLSLLQKNHITHRDIKPQNILLVDGKYKICDFGEIRNMKGDGLVVQRIRGSELYMSPILFYGLRANLIQVKHNTYKSDVFSLGMCLLYAANMHYNGTDDIRELTDMKEIKAVLNKYLSERYSSKLISLIYSMLQSDEQFRPDFEQLELKLSNLLIV